LSAYILRPKGKKRRSKRTRKEKKKEKEAKKEKARRRAIEKVERARRARREKREKREKEEKRRRLRRRRRRMEAMEALKAAGDIPKKDTDTARHVKEGNGSDDGANRLGLSEIGSMFDGDDGSDDWLAAAAVAEVAQEKVTTYIYIIFIVAQYIGSTRRNIGA
jgi:hypothetical protein